MTATPAPPDPAEELPAILWSDAEPGRLDRDHAEMARFATEATYEPPNPEGLTHGGWSGFLPLWPFERDEPEGLRVLLDRGLGFLLDYSAAHPMLPPTIYAIDPVPTIEEQTQAAWHVAPGGSLCLLQSEGAWRPEASIADLLEKAAGWHIEYALMKAGAIERMSINGIAVDSAFDDLITATAKARSITQPATDSTAAGSEIDTDDVSI